MKLEPVSTVRRGDLEQAPGVDLRAVFDAALTPFVVLDPELRIRAMNEAFLNATMTVREQILGLPLFDVFPTNPERRHPEGFSHLRGSLSRVLRSGASDTLPMERYDIRDVGGAFVERYWTAENTAIGVADGSPAYILCHVEDVTAQVRDMHVSDSEARAAEAVRASSDQSKLQARERERQLLARIADDRTRLLHEMALKDEFLGVLSHELKTPITTIIGNAEILRRTEPRLEEEAREAALDDIVSEGDRFTRILDNLLFLARTETGERAQLEPCEIARIARRVVDDQRSRTGRDIVMEADDVTPLIAEGAESYVEQALANLLSNASKYSPEGSAITVVIDDAEGHARLRVLDRGPGFTTDQAAHVFDAFYRIRDQRSLNTGLGIGLAVCKRLVDVMGGTIWAGNRPEGGAEVGFSLPLTQIDD